MKKKFLIIISITMLLIMASPAVAKVYWQDESPQKPIPQNKPNWSQPYGYGNSPYQSHPDYSSPYWYTPGFSSPIMGQTITQPYQNHYWLPQRNHIYVPSPTYYGYVRERSGGYNLQSMKRAYSPEYGEIMLPQQYIYNHQGHGPSTNQPYTPPGYVPPAGNYQYNHPDYQYSERYYQEQPADQKFTYQPYIYGAPKTADQYENWWDSEEWKEQERLWMEHMKSEQDAVNDKEPIERSKSDETDDSGSGDEIEKAKEEPEDKTEDKPQPKEEWVEKR